MGYRADFVREFGKLFMTDSAINHGESHGVIGMDMDEENEIVTVHFRGGYTKQVNVTADSLSAMAYDIIRNGLW